MRRLALCGLLVALVGLPLGAQAPAVIVPALNVLACPPPPNSVLACSLFTSTTSASNVSTSETDLIAYSLPANTLSSNGQKVRVTAWGTFAANANNKTVKLYFGSTVLVTTGAAGFNNQSWEAVGVATRTGAATQVGLGKFFANNGATATNFITTTSPTETLSGAVTIKVTGTSGTASSDVTALGMFVEWVP